MLTINSDNLDESLLPEPLESAVGEYLRWNTQQIEAEQARSAISAPLYQYTGRGGLCGIIESQSVWFTDYRHLNDPSELSHGVEVAHEVIDAFAKGADRRVGLFFGMVRDLLAPRNFVGSLDFFAASFTTQRDDLGQWRAYAENGAGFALGFSAKMFAVVDAAGLAPNELSFVGPVLYDRRAIFARHENAIAAAGSIFLKAAEAHARLFADRRVGMAFMRRMANELIASPLIWNCITSKHIAYENEREVRLVLMNQTENVAPYVRSRRRGGKIVPYIPHPFPVREPGAIQEIVIGPAAGADAGKRVQRMLEEHGLTGVAVRRSSIPYRG
jgi:hypothetical protein